MRAGGGLPASTAPSCAMSLETDARVGLAGAGCGCGPLMLLLPLVLAGLSVWVLVVREWVGEAWEVEGPD